MNDELYRIESIRIQVTHNDGMIGYAVLNAPTVEDVVQFKRWSWPMVDFHWLYQRLLISEENVPRQWLQYLEFERDALMVLFTEVYGPKQIRTSDPLSMVRSRDFGAR
jgi:hypothetical protein